MSIQTSGTFDPILIFFPFSISGAEYQPPFPGTYMLSLRYQLSTSIDGIRTSDIAVREEENAIPTTPSGRPSTVTLECISYLQKNNGLIQGQQKVFTPSIRDFYQSMQTQAFISIVIHNFGHLLLRYVCCVHMIFRRSQDLFRSCISVALKSE